MAASLLFLPGDLSGGTTDWSYFVEGGRDLDWSLYARHPEIQVGPLAILVGSVLGASEVLPRLLIAAMGVVVLFLLEKAARAGGKDERVVRFTTLLGGVLFLSVWEAVVEVVHLDDAMALSLVSLGVYGVATDRRVVAASAMGLAVLAKPWAVVTAPILFGLSGAGLGFVIAGCIAVLGWLPFLAADQSTVEAARFRIPIAKDSGLRVLGLDGEKVPVWIRPVQLVVGAGLALAVARRWSWPAAVFLGIAARAALDGGTHGYYDAALITGALIWDHFVGRSGLPVWTVVIFIFHQGLWVYFSDAPMSGLLLLLLVPLLVGILAFRSREAGSVSGGRRPGPTTRRSPATPR